MIAVIGQKYLMERTQQVWVAFAVPEQQFLISVPFEEGMIMLHQAVQASGLSNQLICLNHFSSAFLE